MPDQRHLAAIFKKRGYAGIKKIGEGAFGVAVLVEDQEGKKAVCKVVDVSSASSSQTQEARKEGRLLAQIKHPYIVRYRENFADRGWLCVVMDFCDGGDLAAQIKQAKSAEERLPEPKVVRWLTQALLALKYLHNKHVLHRDLKPSNLFLMGNGDLRMGDFGISKVMACTGAFCRTFVGTPYYLSPEQILEHPYSWPSDIWSMGCILYQMCALQVPFDAANISGLSKKICGADVPPVPKEYSEHLREIAALMMSRDVDRRPSADAIIGRPEIQEEIRHMLGEARGDRGGEAPEVRPGVKHEILDQFQRFDRNGDGVVDRQELAQVLRHLDATVWTDESIDQILKVVDVNCDGHIQFEEFLQWIFGNDKDTGVATRALDKIDLALQALKDKDFRALQDALLSFRLLVDVGCLRVSSPSLSVKACTAMGRIVSAARSVLEKPENLRAGYGAVRQMRAILAAVEQLVGECSRPHVRRVAGVASEAAVQGLCFELADGTRVGDGPAGLSDAGLDSCDARWEELQEGERVLEVQGHALPAANRPGTRNSVCRPAPDPMPRKSSRQGSRQGPRQGKRTSSAPQLDGCLAADVALCTSLGRTIRFGCKPAGTDGAAFAFKAAEGEEVDGVFFGDRTCRGIYTTPIVVTWPRQEVNEVRAVFHAAAEAVWSMLLRLSWRMGARHGKYALLEARRLGLDRLPVPEELRAQLRSCSASTAPPGHWDLAAMPGAPPPGRREPLGPDVGVGKVHLVGSEVAQLQELLTASYQSARGGAHEADGRTVAPAGIELVCGTRLQNWRSWVAFAARREAIREELAGLKEQCVLREDLVDPALAEHFDLLGKDEVDGETRCVWLFHGVSAAAAEAASVDRDFDIDRAGTQDGRLYGRGAYFTEWCSEVNKLAPESRGGLRGLLLCRVTLGNVLRDESVLPDIVHVVAQCTDGRHHSVLGDRSERCPGDPREFVVYDKDQVYPEFLLWYRRAYR